MKKVKVTQEQADAIENWKKREQRLEHFVKDKYEFTGMFIPLKTLNADTLAKALYIGYEVDPKFEVREWVFDKRDNNFFVIQTTIHAGSINTYSENFRHATPQEIAAEKTRRWWASHGREVWELREGDVLNINDMFLEVERFDGDDIYFSDPADWASLKEMKHNISVVTFAEDRRDI